MHTDAIDTLGSDTLRCYIGHALSLAAAGKEQRIRRDLCPVPMAVRVATVHVVGSSAHVTKAYKMALPGRSTPFLHVGEDQSDVYVEWT